jgi:hypothetical protein
MREGRKIAPDVRLEENLTTYAFAKLLRLFDRRQPLPDQGSIRNCEHCFPGYNFHMEEL